MINTFSDKDQFKESFTHRVEAYYGMKFENTNHYQKYVVLAIMVREHASLNWIESKEVVRKKKLKQVYYFSMEFLMGRLLTNNLMNLGIHSVVDTALKEMGFDLNSIESEESDIGLGNGGLGRLAACFLDSMASLSLPGHGNSIRYRKGFFQQKFIKGEQVELPEQWLQREFVWEVRKDDEAIMVPFYGEIRTDLVNGQLVINHEHPIFVRAVPYDVPIIGHDTKTVNHLTLWSAEPSGDYPYGQDIKEYENQIMQISESLYPDDSTEEGKILRLKQQYFFVCAGLRRIINQHKKTYHTLDNFHELVTLHINDTHPTLLIPELMRILIDEENMSWDKAWHITHNATAYTNHTILSEALEKWPVRLLKPLLPRVYLIIEEMNRRFNETLIAHYGSNDGRVSTLSIINQGVIHMARICIVGAFSVNGVAALHTKILREMEMKDYDELFPNKFNNKTNGITHRRWAYHNNPELTEFFNKYIGKDWVTDINRLDQLNDLVTDEQVKKDFYLVKQARKQKLADYILEREGIQLDVNSIFDIQVKRLHEYKRQLMNALHIIYLYNQLKNDALFYENFHPQTFIFGAKAASSYQMAKKIIKLINTIADLVNHDEAVSQKLKVVFVENYNVTYAEYIMPAANLSEQISTASKEASGTGNMKFMMNGAVTIGTMDGANVEIVDLAGRENAFIFGLSAKEVTDYYRMGNYNPKEVYDNDPVVKQVVDQLISGFFTNVAQDEFKMIYNDLLDKDYFFVLKDFRAYLEEQHQANQAYKNKDKWQEMALKNIANSAFFSSDRTIKQYANEIWHIEPMTFDK